METKITQKTPVQIQVEVQVAWDKVDQHYKKAVKEIAGTVSIPGFRKGRAPAALVVKRFRQDITNSVARENVPQLIIDVIKEKDIKAVGEPHITHFSLKPKEAFSFEFMQEVKPDFEILDWKELEVESKTTNITDEMLEERIKGLLQSNVKTEEIEDRPAETGETVKFQMTVLLNEGNEIIFDENQTLKIDDDFPYPTLKENLLSEKMGEDVEINLTAAEDFEIEAARGKDVKIFLEIQSITKETVPELDEKFAVEHDASSVDDFKSKTKDELEKQTTEMEKARVHSELMNLIVDKYDFELPYSLVFETLKYMANNDLGPYLSYIQDKKQQQALIDNYFQTRGAGAERMVRYDLILEKIALAEGLEISDEELKAKIDEVMPMLPEESRNSIDPDDLDSEFAGRVRSDLSTQKAKDLIYDSAKISWVDELTPKEEPAEDQPEPEEAQVAEAEAVEEKEAGSTPTDKEA